jgi:glycosyltransferase involved in cell wall biosynthesis
MPVTEIKKKNKMRVSTLSSETKTSISAVQAADYAPARILEIELGESLPSVSAVDEKTGQRYQRAMCLVRLHTQPLGVVEFQLVEEWTSPFDYAQHIWYVLGTQINEHLQQDNLLSVTGLDVAGLPGSGTPRCIKERERFLAQAPFVSVVVPTRDRPERIQLCLRSLLTQHYPQYEIIVVDNAPSSTATADFIRQTYGHIPRVRYAREDRLGSSWARNRGIMEARGEILAFIDDDIVVDAYWLVELVKAFSLTNNVACVTGLLLPFELGTPAQFWIEEFGGFGKGFRRRLFDMKKHHPHMPLYPYAAGQFGSGANMAFRAAFLHSVGGFDPTLGPGTPAQGGEDLSLFFQAVIRGYKLVYEPASLGYHPHYREYVNLRKQIYNYGVGLVAYLMKNLLDNPRLLFDFVIKVPYGLYFALSARSSKNRKKSSHYPKELTRLELEGMLSGPFAYLWSRWKIHHSRKSLLPMKVYNALSVEEEA